MYGRVRIYNAGFAIFALTSIVLSLDPFTGGGGALWLIGWRVLQAVGGAMLMANSAAIITDAFSAKQRGMAPRRQHRLRAGRLVHRPGRRRACSAEWDWRSVFWVNIPLGILGHDLGVPVAARHRRPAQGQDRLVGQRDVRGRAHACSAPSRTGSAVRGHTMGWTDPWVLAGLIGGGLTPRRVRGHRGPGGRADVPAQVVPATSAFTSGNAANLLASVARGGLQFMLIIWLQGIWLPLHGYSYESTPLWAGIYLVPMTIGFLAAGRCPATCSESSGPRPFAAAACW
jgi:MFS family permease